MQFGRLLPQLCSYLKYFCLWSCYVFLAHLRGVFAAQGRSASVNDFIVEAVASALVVSLCLVSLFVAMWQTASTRILQIVFL